MLINVLNSEETGKTQIYASDRGGVGIKDWDIVNRITVKTVPNIEHLFE